MTIKEFMKSNGYKTAELIRNPNTNKRFVSFNEGEFKSRVSEKVEQLSNSYVSYFEDTQDWCVVSTKKTENVLDSLSLW